MRNVEAIGAIAAPSGHGTGVTGDRRLRAGLAPAVMLLLAGCAASFADRFATGSAAMNTPGGAAYLIGFAPLLHRALDACLPAGRAGASPVLALVADIASDGTPSQVDVEPDSAATRCVERALREARFPPPPLTAGDTRFPIGLRIDDHP